MPGLAVRLRGGVVLVTFFVTVSHACCFHVLILILVLDFDLRAYFNAVRYCLLLNSGFGYHPVSRADFGHFADFHDIVALILIFGSGSGSDAGSIILVLLLTMCWCVFHYFSGFGSDYEWFWF